MTGFEIIFLVIAYALVILLVVAIAVLLGELAVKAILQAVRKEPEDESSDALNKKQSKFFCVINYGIAFVLLSVLLVVFVNDAPSDSVSFGLRAIGMLLSEFLSIACLYPTVYIILLPDTPENDLENRKIIFYFIVIVIINIFNSLFAAGLEVDNLFKVLYIIVTVMEIIWIIAATVAMIILKIREKHIKNNEEIVKACEKHIYYCEQEKTKLLVKPKKKKKKKNHTVDALNERQELK